LVKVTDAELCRALALLFADQKLAVEPAGAAATAAMLQLLPALAGQRIGLIVCGGNVAPDVFARCLLQGQGGVSWSDPRPAILSTTAGRRLTPPSCRPQGGIIAQPVPVDPRWSPLQRTRPSRSTTYPGVHQ